MALQFKNTSLQFQNIQGKQTETETVSFNNNVRAAETAVRGYTFDFRTGDHHIDSVQVSTRPKRVADNDVEVEVTVFYADKDRKDDYSATVNVLVIADV
jgi:hypothetical protein